MLRLILAAILQAILIGFALGQTGDYPIKDHFPSIPGIDKVSYDIAFDQQGLMYVANRSGLLRYDGRFWEQITTPSSAFSIAVDKNDQVYVGCVGSFGILKLTKSGLGYKELSTDSVRDQVFFSIKVIGDSVMFLSRDGLWTYAPNQQPAFHPSPDDFDLVSLTSDSQGIYINTEIASYLWYQDEFTESDKWIGAEYPPLVLERSPNDSLYLALDRTGKLFVRKGTEELKQILQQRPSIDFIKWVNDSLFVATTTDQGAIIVNSNNNYQVAGRINYENGLPDNEILALEVDWSQGVWLAHQFGFSRVDPVAPVHGLSNKEGLEGNLTRSILFKGELIVGTSSGAYRMVQDSVFRTNATLEKIKVDGSIKPTDKKNGVFKKLFSETTEDQATSTYSYRKQTTRSLEYVRWKYERLSGVVTKSNGFLIRDDVLLVGTNDGLFEYDGNKSVRILRQPVREIIALPNSNEFLVINNDLAVERYSLEDGEYRNLAFGYDASLVLSAYGDQKGLVWLVTPGKVISIGLTYNGASVFQVLEFHNQHLEKPTIVEVDNKLYFITKEGYFSYNYEKRLLLEDTIMMSKIGSPVHHFKDEFNSFWVFDGKLWKHINAQGAINSYSYLSLYPDISFINRSSEGPIYFVDEQNQLYKYLANEDHDEMYQSHIFYKHLFAKSGFTQYQQKINLNYDENYLRAEVTQPDYLGLLQVEFQYIVDGLDDQWSEWTSDNKIQLNFIPDGSYLLRIRSRDVFGRIQEGEPVELIISPPYWRTSWFYMLEALFFAGLVIVSARLNQGKVRNRFITEGLTILTIVMIIEFLQSVAQSYFDIASSPIFDFLINLSVALIIFPLEIALQRIIRGRKSGYQLVGTEEPEKIKSTEKE